MKKFLLILLIIPGLLMIHGVQADQQIEYHFSITPSNNGSNYLFKVFFTTNQTILAVNMTVDNSVYNLKFNTNDNIYYTTIPTDLSNKYVELKVLTNEGLTIFNFPNPIETQNQSLDELLSIFLFSILLFLIVKYVLFYQPKL